MATLKSFLNKVSQNSLFDALRAMKFGDMIRALPTQLNAKAPAASALQLGTLNAISLPAGAKAARILAAYSRAPTPGNLTPVLYGVTPSTGEIGIAPNGDIVVLASDAATKVDVVYQPLKGEEIELTGSVATGVFAIPTKYQARVLLLTYAELTAGTVTGVKNVLVPAGSLPATTKAALKTDYTQVLFNNATDAGTAAKVRLLLAPETDVDAMLEAESNFV